MSAIASSGSCERLAVVDISAFYSNDAEKKKASISGLLHALQHVGFCYVVGHRVTAGLTKEAIRQTKLFFDLPIEAKAALKDSSRVQPRGYTSIGRENVAAFMGKKAPSDIVEKFSLGMLETPSDIRCQEGESKELFLPNIWPPAGELPMFRKVLEEYIREVKKLLEDLMEMVSVALGLDKSFFHSKTDIAPHLLRCLNYPTIQRASAGPTSPTRTPVDEFDDGGVMLRMASHTDLGTLTILSQDNGDELTDGAPAKGLQVLCKGEWIDVVPMPNAFVVNVGDVLMQWSNDQLKSTVHRVVQPFSDFQSAGRKPCAKCDKAAADSTSSSSSSSPFPAFECKCNNRRVSLGFFGSVNYDAVIESVESRSNPAKYQPTTWKEYVKKKIAALQYDSPPLENGKPLESNA